MNGIYHISEFNRYIDLDRLVSVSDVYRDYVVHPYYVEFAMDFQLKEEPIIIRKNLEWDEDHKHDFDENCNITGSEKMLTKDYEWVETSEIEEENLTSMPEFKMQKIINKILVAWHEHKRSKQEEV